MSLLADEPEDIVIRCPLCDSPVVLPLSSFPECPLGVEDLFCPVCGTRLFDEEELGALVQDLALDDYLCPSELADLCIFEDSHE